MYEYLVGGPGPQLAHVPQLRVPEMMRIEIYHYHSVATYVFSIITKQEVVKGYLLFYFP
jgi:hypothetical protein